MTRCLRPLFFAAAIIVIFVAAPAWSQGLIPLPSTASSDSSGEKSKAEELGVTPEQVQSLVATLKDDAARQHLIDTLEALVAVQEEQKNNLIGDLDTVGAQLLSGVSEAMGQVGLVVERVGNAFVELHQFLLRLKDQALDGEARDDAIRIVLQLAITLGAAIGGLLLTRLLLLRPYRQMSDKRPKTVARRIPHLLGRLFLDLVRLGVTAIAGYGALLIVQDTSTVRVMTLAILNAILVTGVVYAIARFVLAPSASGIRLFPIDDMVAEYLYIWVRRLTVPSVFGYFLLQMAVVLGIAPSTYRALLWLLGLLIAVLVIILILQNRAAVSRWISGAAHSKRLAEEEERRKAEAAAHAESVSGQDDSDEGEFIPTYVHMPALRFLTLRRWIAPVWHLLAILYVLVFYVIWVIQGDNGYVYLASATLWTAAIFAVALTVLASVERLLRKAFSVSPELKEQFPELEARANRYMPILSFIVKAAVLIVAVLGILQAWDIGGFVWLATDAGRNILGSVVSIVIAIGVSIAVWEVSTRLIERRLADRTDDDGNPVIISGRTRTILGLVRNTTRIVLAVMLIIIILSEIGVDITPLLAGAGVIGLAIGFGAQTLVKDIITGLFILFEDTVSVGDVATLGGHTGVVEAMSIRTARLRDLSGTVHVVPYSEVTTVENLTKDFSFALLEVGVAYREDVDQVMQVLHQIGDELRRDRDYRRDILEPLEMLGVDSFGDSAVIIKCRIKTKPIRQWYVMRGFNRLMKKRFDELGIEIPFPHQTIYFGVDKEGKAPAARIEIDKLERLAGGELSSESTPETNGESGPSERS